MSAGLHSAWPSAAEPVATSSHTNTHNATMSADSIFHKQLLSKFAFGVFFVCFVLFCFSTNLFQNK